MNELIKWSSVLYLSIASCLDKRLAKFEINSSQFFYILRICENPGITREYFIDTIYRNQSNITRALYQLEEKDYIRRVQNKEDKRTYNLYPTEKANRDYEEIQSIVTTLIKEILEPFSEKEADLLPKLLKKAGLTAFEINLEERDKEKKEPEEC